MSESERESRYLFESKAKQQYIRRSTTSNWFSGYHTLPFYTTTPTNIRRGNPAGGTILQELPQKADDSGATKVVRNLRAPSLMNIADSTASNLFLTKELIQQGTLTPSPCAAVLRYITLINPRSLQKDNHSNAPQPIGNNSQVNPFCWCYRASRALAKCWRYRRN